MTTHPVDVARPVDAPVPTRRYVLVADDSAEMRGLLTELLGMRVTRYAPWGPAAGRCR
jgi:hypothetical protein